MEFDETNAQNEGYFAMKCFKRYAVSCLVAMFVFAAIDGYNRPGQDPRFGAILITAAVWPVFAAIVVGGSIGDVTRQRNDGKLE